jgi:adenylosuccinate lyase
LIDNYEVPSAKAGGTVNKHENGDAHDEVYQSAGKAIRFEGHARDLFDENRFQIWRRIWIALAEAEKEMGLEITDSQIAQLKAAPATSISPARRRSNERSITTS